MSEWKILSKEKIYKDHWKCVEKWRMQNPHGRANDFTIVINRDIVIVFGITADEKVLVTHEYFMAHEKKMLGMVAGMVEQDDLKQVAMDELRQEAGCEAKEMVYLGKGNHGKYTTGAIHYFLAKDIKQVGEQELEENEDIDIEFVSLAKFREMLKSGELEPLHEVVCAYKALDYLKML